MVHVTKNEVSKAFEDAIRAVEASGKETHLEDAVYSMDLKIQERDVESAVPRDENSCVVAVALKRKQKKAVAVSVCQTVLKVLFPDGTIMRWGVPKLIRGALDGFDVDGKWNLAPGTYTFNPPTTAAKLFKNKPESYKEKQRKRFQKLKQNLEQSGTNGNGMTKARSRPMPTRQITFVRSKSSR